MTAGNTSHKKPPATMGVPAGAKSLLSRTCNAPIQAECSAGVNARPTTTLADLLTPLLDTNPFSTVRASFRWQLSNERDNGVADGRQAWLRRRSIDSFFPASLF